MSSPLKMNHSQGRTMKRLPKLINRSTEKEKRQGRANTINDLQNELLMKIFRLLRPSDILRCSRVCKRWYEVCDQNSMWRMQFGKLPDKVQKLSVEAKKATNKEVMWKQETISCAKKLRKKETTKLLKKKNQYSGLPEKTNLAVSFLAVRWVLAFTDVSGKRHEFISRDAKSSTTSFSVSWDKMDLSFSGKHLSMEVYALCPLFFDESGKPDAKSVCTRSLLQAVSIKGDVFKDVNCLGKDAFVTVFTVCPGLSVGLWQDKGKGSKTIAFVLQQIHSCGIVDRILNGKSSRSHVSVHQPVLDDVDSKYGLQRYSAFIELRSGTKILWSNKISEFFKVDITDGFLVMLDEISTNQCGFDIRWPFTFSWNSGSIEGFIKDVAALDFTLIDSNNDFIWQASEVVKVTPVEMDQVTYDFGDSEAMSIVLKEKGKGQVAIQIAVDSKSNACAVRTIQVKLEVSFINSWFGTFYR